MLCYLGIALLVEFGSRNETLDLIKLTPNADFKKDLASRILPN